MAVTNFTLDDAMLDPSKHYDHPDAVAQDNRFSLQDQRRILQAWLDTEEALQRAATEGLDGGTRPHLRSVAIELQKLDDQLSKQLFPREHLA